MDFPQLNSMFLNSFKTTKAQILWVLTTIFNHEMKNVTGGIVTSS